MTVSDENEFAGFCDGLKQLSDEDLREMLASLEGHIEADKREIEAIKAELRGRIETNR